MPYCSILECKNDSRRTNINNAGVSYHRFPKDCIIKGQWIDATGRVNWMPTKLSTICSRHFLEEDFLISVKGYRYLRSGVSPTLKTLKYLSQQRNYSDASAESSENEADFSSSALTQPKKRSTIHNVSAQKRDEIKLDQETIEKWNAISDSKTPMPRTKKLERQLQFCQTIIKRQRQKIKLLQLRNLRLKRKFVKLNVVSCR